MSKTKNKESSAAAEKPAVKGERKLFAFSKEERICGILLLGLILLVISIRSNFSGIAFERDEGIYAYNGIKVLEGKTPYIDFYEQKFPGIFYFYAMMVALFGDSVEGLHAGWTVINIISILLIFFAARILFNPVAGIFSAITYAFISLSPTLSGFTIQSEHGVSLFVSLGILFYALVYKTGKLYYYFLMGIAMGLSFMVKTSGIFLIGWAGIMVFVDFFVAKKKSVPQLIKTALLYGVGVLIPALIFFLIILSKGALDQMIYFGIEIPKKYVGKIPLEEGKKYFKYTLDALLFSHKFLWMHAFAAVALLLFKEISLKLKLMGLTLAIFSFFTIVPGYYFYGHYWMQLVPCLALLSGFMFWGVIQILGNRFNLKSPTIRYAYLGIFILFTLIHLSKQKSYYFYPNYDLILRQVYGNNPFPEAKAVGDYINNNSKPEDQIAIIGSEPQIYVYTKKKCPSRHAYFAALVTDVPEHKEWQREFIRDVEAARPKHFVFFRHGISLFVQPNTDQHIFEWVNQYASENYKVVGVIDMVDGQQSTYVWNNDVNSYQPKGQNTIFIFERKT